MPFATAATAALGAVRPQNVSKASGATNTIQRFGGVFGLAVSTAIFTASGQLTTPAGFVAGFRPAELAAALLAVIGAVAALYVGRAVKQASLQARAQLHPAAA